VSHRYGIFSWWWAHCCPKHVERSNKHITKICAPSWFYLQRLYKDARSTKCKFICVSQTRISRSLNVWSSFLEIWGKTGFCRNQFVATWRSGDGRTKECELPSCFITGLDTKQTPSQIPTLLGHCPESIAPHYRNGKGKFPPGTGHEVSEVEEKNSSTLSLTSAQDGVGGKRHTPVVLPREKPGTHCIGGWVGSRAGLDRCENLAPHRD
jgi:hypothetical protein